MSDEILKEMSNKLDILIKLIASETIEGDESKTDSILKLGTLGLDRNLIAEIVGTTTGTVSTRLAEAKKKR